MEKPHKLLKSPMALYVHLYCKKNGRTRNRQNNLIEAAKSWVSMGKVERQYFMNVFKNYETKVKKCFASNLQSAQLYMKKRNDNKKSGKPNQLSICPNKGDEEQEIQEMIQFSPCHSEEDNNQTEAQQDLNNTEGSAAVIPEENGSHVHFEEGPLEPTLVKSISEPTPPIRTSMELYEILKRNEETQWSDLTKSQKQRYQRAVLSIKKNYLKEYITYLQELTPERLFLHYKSKC